MMTGRLMHHKGSLARDGVARVTHLKWSWHRVERALERGKFWLGGLFNRLTHLVFFEGRIAH
jgi:hypothetical protein